MLEERIDVGNEDYNEEQSLPDLAHLAWIVEANHQNYIFNPQDQVFPHAIEFRSERKMIL